jgi:hypothetical protein
MIRGWIALFNTVNPFPIQKLTFPAIMPDSVEHLVRMLRQLPNLSHLYLSGPAVDQLIQRLIVDLESSATIILPHLTFLDIRNANLTDVTLYACITSRNTSAATARGVSRVAVVNLYECSSISPSMWKVVQDLLV